LAESAAQTITVEVDEASLQSSLMQVRGLLYEINSVRNLASDTMRMAEDPSLGNAFWLGMQVQSTGRRLRGLPDTFTQIGSAVSSLGAFAVTPMGALTVGAVATAAVVGGLVLSDLEKRRVFEDWQTRMSQVAKQQGLTP
jgi:hypothetical protein